MVLRRILAVGALLLLTACGPSPAPERPDTGVVMEAETLPGQKGDTHYTQVRRAWLADFYAPELKEPGGRKARDTLKRIASGRRVDCVSRGRSWDRVAAECRLAGRSLGDHMRAAGVREGGRGRAPRPL